MTMALDRAPAKAPSLFWVWLAAVPAVFALVTMALWPALTGVPFWDDLYSLVAIENAAKAGRPAFAVTGDMMAFWRPIELFLIALLRPVDPVGILGVKLASLGLHGLKALAVAFLVRRLAPGLSPSIAVVAGLVALAHPIATSVIVQIDTISEGIAACAIAWAFVLTLDAAAAQGAARRMRLLGAAALGAVALFGKESAVPAVMALPLVALIAAPDRKAIFLDLVWFGVLLAAAIAVFVGLRFSLGFSMPATNDGRYNVGFGANIAKNLATVAGSLSFFGNTVTLIGNRVPAASIGFAPVLVGAGLFAVALLRRRRETLTLIHGPAVFAAIVMALAATAAPSLAPMISEHNAALPSSAAIAIALALIGAAATALGTQALRIGALAAMLAVAFGITAIMQKSDAAAAMGERIAGVRAEIDTFLYGHDTLTICVTPTDGRAYSIYQLPAERWIGEEVVLARHTWPAKTIGGMLAPAGNAGCDLVVPNFPPA